MLSLPKPTNLFVSSIEIGENTVHIMNFSMMDND